MPLLRLARSRYLTSSPTLLRTLATTHPLRYHEDTSSDIVIPRLKADLKDAMRAKDKPRLDVIRAILAEITNASKTAKPISSDARLYSLLQKQINAARSAIDEFSNAKRDDLVEKEQGQLKILKDYTQEIPTVSAEEMDRIVADVVQRLDKSEVKFGPIMGKVMGAMSPRPCDLDLLRGKIEEVVRLKKE
ncbi:Yqey-like protein-domain-containing protein [Massariosphaeria phaeospora]|uniref:Altered inheritance of mitochondria protein 41 n=1 Tax=Massariosphaeria phaeospora TaxID=100035 RepID=A0A7C8MJ69_9PLEO|nr:Yqey-like protein-domain-containing protein [Massariosphaeria phaeospora]